MQMWGSVTGTCESVHNSTQEDPKHSSIDRKQTPIPPLYKMWKLQAASQTLYTKALLLTPLVVTSTLTAYLTHMHP